MDDPAKQPLLILDLDETLIHGAEARLHRDPDFMIGPFFVYKRPYLESFLATTSAHFDVAIWSSASSAYVEGIASRLSSFVPAWQFVWSRERCVRRMHAELMTTTFIKDLRKVQRRGYDLDCVLIVDDTHQKLARNYGNAIFIPRYEGTDDDTELRQLAKYVVSLRHERNFRTIEKRGWRSKKLPD